MEESTAEVVEPTNDVSYLKRHDKPEKEEKQRKRCVLIEHSERNKHQLLALNRWDAQRVRQEQQLQNLRARQEKKSLKQSKSKCQPSSLLPALDEISTICVEEDIPVSIFGRPLPDTGAKAFSLPW